MNNYLSLSKSDLKAAAALINISPQNVPSLCEQAIEKLLKHYIFELTTVDDFSLFKSHNLKKLARMTNIPELNNYLLELSDLTDFYFDTRYPGEEFIEVSVEEAQQCYNTSCKIFEVIESKIYDIQSKATKRI